MSVFAQMEKDPFGSTMISALAMNIAVESLLEEYLNNFFSHNLLQIPSY